MEQEGSLRWIPLGPGCGALQVVDLCPSLRTAGKRQCHMCNREQGWMLEATLSWRRKPAGQGHPKHWVGPESSRELAAFAAHWIVCCWKSEHHHSASLWNLLHRISFTLSKTGSSWKRPGIYFLTIKACAQMPSCGNLHTQDYGNYPIVKSCWTNGQMAKLLPPSLTVFYLILPIRGVLRTSGS